MSVDDGAVYVVDIDTMELPAAQAEDAIEVSDEDRVVVVEGPIVIHEDCGYHPVSLVATALFT